MSEAKQFSYLSKLGGHNDMPEPARECTQDEFYHVWKTESVLQEDYRSIVIDSGPMKTVIILFFHDVAFAVVFPDQLVRGSDKIQYHDKPRYFELGCDHDYRELGQKECKDRGIKHWGMCWHEWECKKCGQRKSYDSSG